MLLVDWFPGAASLASSLSPFSHSRLFLFLSQARRPSLRTLIPWGGDRRFFPSVTPRPGFEFVVSLDFLQSFLSDPFIELAAFPQF